MLSTLRRSISKTKDIADNFEPVVGTASKIMGIVSNSVKALIYPQDGQYLSTFGELTSDTHLPLIREKMLSDETGRRILE